MPPTKIERAAFEERSRSRFVDPAFRRLQKEIDAMTAAAWARLYNFAIDLIAAKQDIENAQGRYDDPKLKPRILVINGSSRNEHACPGEMSESWRMVELFERGAVTGLLVCRCIADPERCREHDPGLP